ncbi:hypothetical protein C0989_004059 [Termitomyces sp. Mn162]|nr:hypothetical protein C0989_004059 [Termitomyces sp. Mn162]
MPEKMQPKSMTLFTLQTLSLRICLRTSSKLLLWTCVSYLGLMTGLSLGPVALDTVEQAKVVVTEEEKARQARFTARPPLNEILNLHDFEAIAQQTMTDKAWAYYSSAADDEITNRENHAAYHRHIPTLASCSFDEIVDGAQPGQVQFFQLYVNKDRAITKRIVQHAEQRGIKGLFITVDAPQLGRREKDMRMKFEAEDPSEVTKAGSEGVDRSQGAARAISSFIDPGLNWNDLVWFKSITRMPLILKGVQCWEDAMEAYDRGLAGVVLSNHGGRQLDFARSGIEVLVEVVGKFKAMRGLTFPNEKFQLFVDGGVRRATDVLKAVALGATAVGVGRPFLYAYSTYGPEGIDKALQILHDEFEMNMRLLGAKTMKDVVPSMVDASNIHTHIVAVPEDRLYDSNCSFAFYDISST